MRLVTDHSLAAAAVSVPCIQCGRMHVLAQSIIDRDGPAFRAYYCPTCAPQGKVSPCEIYGCARGGRAHQD